MNKKPYERPVLTQVRLSTRSSVLSVCHLSTALGASLPPLTCAMTGCQTPTP
jgi:hypothetical protein